MAQLLASYGAEVRCAAGADAALHVLAVWRPDVLVSDLAMPLEDGCSLLARVRGQPGLRDLPAIAVTAHAGPEEAQKVLAAGFRVRLAKPVEAAVLLEAVAQAGTAAAPGAKPAPAPSV
jgi:CheY-like chemotaxis protein